MTQISVGTAAWDEPSLIHSGLFYPREVVSPLARLRYYGERYALTEVDATFHQLPTVRAALQWCEHTPPAFVFDVRAFRLLTEHQTSMGALPNDIRAALDESGRDSVRYRDLPRELQAELWQRFFLGIEPLRRAGKLGALILHFPASFIPTAANIELLAAHCEKLKQYCIAIEFSHRSWYDEERFDNVLKFERERSLVHVVGDEPDRSDNTAAARWTTTQQRLAVVRAHGPARLAREAKRAPPSAAAPNHSYSEEDLKALAGRVRRLGGEVDEVHVIFSNCHGNCAQRNAAQFKLVLAWLDGG